jgi:hypothetical protein
MAGRLMLEVRRFELARGTIDRMSFTRAFVIGAAVMLAVSIVSKIVGGTIGWIIVAAGAVALGLGLGVLDRRQRAS